MKVKITVFRDVTPCSFVEVYQCSEGALLPQVQNRRTNFNIQPWLKENVNF
jgi:hypothetical protein